MIKEIFKDWFKGLMYIIKYLLFFFSIVYAINLFVYLMLLINLEYLLLWFLGWINVLVYLIGSGKLTDAMCDNDFSW